MYGVTALTRRTIASIGLATALALTFAACGDDDNPTPGASGTPKAGGTLVFGTTADPINFDGAYVSDGESLRAIDQMFEGLVRTKLGGTDIEPLLAESFTASTDGLAWTFKLRTGVKFHDGTDFNAKAVCYNFDRWYNFKGIQQAESVSYYWTSVFGGFSDGKKPSLYKSCAAPDDATAVINLTKRSSSFLSGLALKNFAIASPTALAKYGADKVSGDAKAPKFDGEYGLKYPTGTGPFKFVSFTPKDKLVMARNDDYWGPKAKLDQLIFKAISDNAARKQALEKGEIQGYDFVEPGDLDALKGAGFQILERPAFNVGYVGFNSSKPPTNNPKIRQAIAHALNREALLTAKYPPGSQVATQFMPPELFGWSENVTKYEYDVDKAKALIADSGVSNPTLEFWYPTDVTRGYMPDPEANFLAFKADLEKAGFKVNTKSAPWNPQYLNNVDTGTAGNLRLLGWNGDFGDPDNFIGVFFQKESPAWGFKDPAIFAKLDAAEAETDLDKRTQLYQEANELIMAFLPGVPYVHTRPALAFAKNVSGYVPSPVTLEPFSIVSLG